MSQGSKRVPVWLWVLIGVAAVATIVIVAVLGMRTSPSDSMKSGQTEQAHASCDELSIKDKAYTVHEGSVTEGDLKLEILDTNVDAASAIEKIKFAEPPVAEGKFLGIQVRVTNVNADPDGDGVDTFGMVNQCGAWDPHVSFLTVENNEYYQSIPSLFPGDSAEVWMYFDVPVDIENPVLVVPVPNVGNVVMGLPG